MSNAIKEAQEILQKMTEEILMNHPVWMKCNYLLSQLGSIPEEKWKDIKWDYINKVLKETNLEIDFNIFDEIDLFLYKEKYHSHYTRIICESENRLKLDVGSYTEFFIITNEDNTTVNLIDLVKNYNK